MTQPATGTTFKAGGFNDFDSRFFERGGKIAALVRQARGTATDLSPHDATGAIKWCPFALDGQLRNDLFGWRRTAGVWAPVATTNEGFHLVGAFKEGDGPSVKTSFDDDDYQIEQTNAVYDSERVKEDEPFTLTPVETLRPVLRRLRNGLPLNAENGDNLVEYPGQPNTVFVKPLDSTPVFYQMLLIREFNKPAGKIITVKGYNLLKNNDIGDAKMGKKDAEAAELTMKPLPDGIFMGMQDGEYQPILKAEWIGGLGYAALYGSAVSQYTVTLGTQSSGTFQLGLVNPDDSSTIAFGATAANVKSALVGIDDGYTASDWDVSGSSGGPFTVTTPAGRALKGTGANLGTPGNFSIVPVSA